MSTVGDAGDPPFYGLILGLRRTPDGTTDQLQAGGPARSVSRRAIRIQGRRGAEAARITEGPQPAASVHGFCQARPGGL